MGEYKADFIKVPPPPNGFSQTMPVEPHRRLKNDDISVALCDPEDCKTIAEGLYACFPEIWWAKMEPPALRPPSQTERVRRLAKRLRPSFLNPNMRWLKAVHVPTGQVVGIAGWAAPGCPVHNVWRKSAIAFYGWQAPMGWSDADVEDAWAGVDLERWESDLAGYDKIREEVMQGEPHWFLAPLMTWPEWQGRGVGSKLLEWAIRQADATVPVTPLYLESAPTARAVYMHYGFVPCGEKNLVRRGPAVVRGLEAEDGKEWKVERREVAGKSGKVNVDVTAKEAEVDMAHG